ncbi:hypothetical protein DsansV1_C02g0015741 [Dioscorea sansibarensis]
MVSFDSLRFCIDFIRPCCFYSVFFHHFLIQILLLVSVRFLGCLDFKMLWHGMLCKWILVKGFVSLHLNFDLHLLFFSLSYSHLFYF